MDAPEALAARWVPGAGAVHLRPLAAGLVNHSYRVERGGRVYAMRLAADRADIGVDRAWECRVLRCASRAGLCPTIVRCEPAHGILVAQWIDGRPWTPREVRQSATIRSLARLARRVHALALPEPARVMSPGAWIERYGAALGTAVGSAAGGAASTALRAPAAARLTELARMPDTPAVLCHSDLHRLNVVAGDSPVLLDWEYAHVSDPFWDLAAWIANNDGTPEFAGELLAEYLGRPAGGCELQRLRLLTWLHDYVCLLWSELYLRRTTNSGRGTATPADEIAARARLLAERLGGGQGTAAPGPVVA